MSTRVKEVYKLNGIQLSCDEAKYTRDKYTGCLVDPDLKDADAHFLLGDKNSFFKEVSLCNRNRFANYYGKSNWRKDAFNYHREAVKSYKNAVKLYMQAARTGDAHAQCNLGVCYAFGKGVTKNYKKAVEWFTKSAEQGYADAQFNLGVCYHNGYGCDNETLIKSCRSRNASDKMGYLFRKVAERDRMTVEWFTKAAEQGNANAQCNLGFYYAYGKVVKQDHAKAIELFTKSAEQGNVFAQFNLGRSYEKGYCVEKDCDKAIEWYVKAAKDAPGKKGDADAQYRLGCIYEKMQKDTESWSYYLSAACQGHAFAQCKMGLHDVKSWHPNYKSAAEWFTKSAEQGCAVAIYNLGVSYEYGRGVPQNERKAYKLYQKAANLGCAKAQSAIANRWVYDDEGEEW